MYVVSEQLDAANCLIDYSLLSMKVNLPYSLVIISEVNKLKPVFVRRLSFQTVSELLLLSRNSDN